MQYNPFIFFLLIAMTLSCTQSKSPEAEPKTNSFWKSELERMEELLPRKYNATDYFLVFRIGSIEFSSECTVLCIPKKQLKDKNITCGYFSINEYREIGQQSLSPTVIGHQLTLVNEHPDFDPDKLQHIDFSNFDNYVHSRPKEYSGEWHCGNLFVINPNSDHPLLLNNASGKAATDFMIALYQQISPSEYFQCTALTSTCEDRQDLIAWLRSPQANDSLNFKIPKDDWYIPGWGK